MECVCEARPMQQLSPRAPPRARNNSGFSSQQEQRIHRFKWPIFRNNRWTNRKEEVRVNSREDERFWGNEWWKHTEVMVAGLVFSLSLPCSSPSALEIAQLQQAQVEVHDLRFDETRRAPLDTLNPSLVAVDAKASISSVANVVQTVSKVAVPKALPVIHPVVVTSGSRVLARILQHFGGGGIAGAIGAALVYPLDTIKTRMQAQSSKDGDQCKYKNEIDCFRKVVTDEGMGSLYTGLLPQLVGIAPEKALKLTVNEVLLEMLEHIMPGTGLWFLELIAGSGGGFSQVVVTNPMEIVKVRLQTQEESKKRGIREVIRELGFRGLYHGSAVTLARDIPSSGIFFACYALLKQLYPDQSFADGFLAAIPATLISTPMDVVKTRLQMELPEGETRHESALSCLKSVWEAEGPRALFKGSLTRVLRTSPQFGVTLLVYNLICGGGS